MEVKNVIIVTAFFIAMVFCCGVANSQVEFNFAAAITAPGQCLMAHPRATKSIGIAVNLQADASILPAFDPADPSGTSNYSSSVTIYDRLGQSHVVTIYFKKIAEGNWEWHARDAESLPTDPEAGSGTLAFTADGLLQPGRGSPVDFVFNFSAGTQTISLALDGSLGGIATTQYPMASATLFQTQDGYTPWMLGLISPNGGEVWGANSTHLIEWCGVGEEMKVRLSSPWIMVQPGNKSARILSPQQAWHGIFLPSASGTKMSRQGNLVQQVGRRTDNLYVRETIRNRRGRDSIPHPR